MNEDNKKGNAKKYVIIFLILAIVIAVAVFAIFKLANNKKSEDLPTIESLSLEEIENMEDVEVYFEEGKSNILIAGKFTEAKVTNEQEAVNVLNAVKDILKIGNIENEFKVMKNDKFMEDSNYRIQQYYNDIIVDGMQLIVTADKDGNVKSLSGDYLKLENFNTEAKIENDELKKIITDKYGAEIEITDSHLEITKINEEPLLVWATATKGTYSGLEGNSYLIYIDANTGKIVEVNSLECGVDYGTSTIDNKQEKFEIAEANNIYYLQDLKRNIKVSKLEGVWSYVPFSSTNPNNWEDKDAVRAYIGVQKVWDYYNTKLSYNITQNNLLLVAIHEKELFGRPLNNASYSKDGDNLFLRVGDGDGKEYRNFGLGLDVLGHEMTHAYVDLTLGSFKNGEINEAYADIMGNIIENYYEEKTEVKSFSANENLTFSKDPNWLIGEDITITSNGLRSLANPEQHENAKPSIINGKNYKTGLIGTGLFLDEHENCTVLGHTSYLMWKEGYTTDEIAYIFTNSCTRLTKRASYEDVGRMLITISNEKCPAKTPKLKNILIKQRILENEENTTNEEITNEEISNQKVTKADYFYKYNENTYYWKLSAGSRTDDELFCNYKDIPGAQNELIKIDKNGNETVVYKGEGSKALCVVNDRVFLSHTTDEYENSRMIYSIKLDGTDKQDHVEGEMLYVVGDYVIYQDKNGSICALNTKDYQATEVVKKSEQQEIEIITNIDNILYYSIYDYTNKTIGISSITGFESTSVTTISISKAYGEGFETLPLEVAYMWIKDDKIHMYIDYRAGTANMVNGIVEVTMDKDLKNATVTKVEDAKIETVVEVATNGIFETTKLENGKNVTYLMTVDKTTGEIQTLLNKTNLVEKYNLTSDDEHYSQLYKATQVGDDIYMIFDNGVHSPENDIGWRYSYKREKTICLKYNIKTQETTTIFEF